MKRELINGELLKKEAYKMIKEIKASEECKNGIICIEDYMNDNEVFDELLGMNESVWYAVYNFISFHIGYMELEDIRKDVNFTKFTSYESIENFDSDRYDYCCHMDIEYDLF